MKNKILLVEEEPRLRAALNRRLRRDFDVTTATSNQNALDLLRTKGPFSVAIRTEKDHAVAEPFLRKLGEDAPETGRMVLGDRFDGLDEVGRVHTLRRISGRGELVRAIERCICACQGSQPLTDAAHP